jgi:CheY-like chemotaxis protein
VRGRAVLICVQRWARGHGLRAIEHLRLAGETTIDFAHRLARHPIPFVFSTGYGIAGMPLDLRDRPVLAKPFSPRDLKRAIEYVLSVTD